ncbi:Mu-like prophage I protein [Tistlia consotensis]|uniref:Mu-like prophage I protein n=1 Tax=Tistlia consotensis USBA 355 TaxID=560819 RepID=A0A1Y6C444_9PROT|nr:phage protease [Tistlia consotensis]SMF42015.1 Mu-like prophage I protein [Tistlia consotensis USBA 355]SMF66274.1 Mu-like prophage I protein [Tistlia consotensis USBA 355]SNR73130.1 Mu-like prophage I protein [Tistlia consotensis]
MLITASSVIALHATPTAKPYEQWVHLIPAGTFSGRDGRGPYRLTDAAAVIEAARRYAGTAQIPIDYDHALDKAAPEGRPAPAAGWIKGLQARADGIWGLVAWTERAAASIWAREYRYLSPVFRHRKDGTITNLLRAGLTNVPNLELTALASQQQRNGDPSTMDMEEFMRQLRAALGLPDDADASAILAELKNAVTAAQSAAPDPAHYVPIGEFERLAAELNRVNQGVSVQAAEIAVDREITAGRLAPFLREWGVNLCSVNKPAFDGFMAKTGPAIRQLFEPGPATALPPKGWSPGGSALDDTERAVCAALGHTPEEFTRNREG